MVEEKSRISGQMMGRFVGQQVVIVGNLTKVDATGECVELTTFDNVKINATLPTRLEVNPEGIIQVSGIVKSRGTIQAEHYVHFPAENSKDFDPKLYNNLIVIQHALGSAKWELDAGAPEEMSY
ncbi:uncharacterized protein [Venturia canescens]|uniref:uncharacterized protein n=1 Tax=Venturia canescens TaxID=32260 RepID=UPI001C9BD9F0|nr:uncharacterized protein LOC122406833 [Venturia canescens]